MQEQQARSSESYSAQDLSIQVVKELAEVVEEVVLCPGSRNSPLTLALLAQTGIRVHTRIDERSAAFLALGMARVSKRPVAVVMTSGTAVANALPAMIEAHYSHTPLFVLSADRPARLQGVGASQTIEQQGLFGVFARGVQVEKPSDLLELKEALRAPQVHINLALDTPLVDKPVPVQPASARARLDYRVDHGEVEIDLSRNTLVIAGDEAWEVEGLEDVPTIAEPSAPAPYHPVHPLAASFFRTPQVSANDYVVSTKPEQLVVVGHPTLHREVLALMNDPDIDMFVLSRTPDFCDPRRTSAKGTRVKVSGEPSAQWLKICAAASEVGAQAVREILEQKDFGFSGLHVAAALADQLGTGDTVVLGASNPVRDASLAGLPIDGVDTFAPRGAAGIDGTISQAIGVALARQHQHADAPRAPRTLALLGDITFLHEVGGLLIGPEEPRPENLTLLVANDCGGGIFETLEMGAPELRESFERGFATPHEVDISALCQAYGIEYVLVESLPELIEALSLPYFGVQVIEARTTRSTRREMHAALESKVRL